MRSTGLTIAVQVLLCPSWCAFFLVWVVQKPFGSLLGYFGDLLTCTVFFEANAGVVLQTFDLADLIVKQSDLVTDFDDAGDTLVKVMDSLLHDTYALGVLADVPRLLAQVEVPV